MGSSALQKEPQIPTAAHQASVMQPQHPSNLPMCYLHETAVLHWTWFFEDLHISHCFCLELSSRLATSLMPQVRLHIPIQIRSPLCYSLLAPCCLPPFITICHYVLIC